MRTATLCVLAMLCTICQSSASAQSGAAPTAAIDITDEQVKKVNAATGTDRQLRIVDMGKYNLAVGIIHRGPSARTTAGGAARPGGAPPAASGAPAPVPCGETGGPNSGVSGLYHDATAETYIIVSGSGTLVTGGRIVNGRRSAAESDVTRILNGPSCSGLIGGTDVVRRVVKPGDIIIIPAGVPHGWTEITDHVDYLSVRPDPDKVLQAGYVHPAIAK